jgi:hypothetical protein
MNTPKLAALLVLPALLAGCGGDDNGDVGAVAGGNGGGFAGFTTPPSSAASSAEGVYAGVVDGHEIATHFQALVLENGEFWSIYGEDFGSIFYVYGFVQGQGISNNGTFTASAVRDYGYTPALPGQANATYNTTDGTITGTMDYGSFGVAEFDGGPIDGSLYNYDAAASLTTIVGTWDTISLYGRDVTVNISSTGVLTLADGTCTGSGMVVPRATGKNVFTVTVTYGFVGCEFPGTTNTGIAIAFEVDTGETQLIAAVANSARTEGDAVFGIR